MLTKYLIVLDDECSGRPPDMHSSREVLFRLCVNTTHNARASSPKTRPMQLRQLLKSRLEKVAIDATQKFADE